MFEYIKGKLIYTEPNAAVIECAGIGYRFTVSSNTIASLSASSGEVCLYTYLAIREDAIELIGFYNRDELDMFKKLISVSGVGPKAAIAILSEMTCGQLVVAISSGDSKRISKAQGVGSKTAQRVILELKDKVQAYGSSDDEEDTIIEVPEAQGKSNKNDAIKALMVLGYTVKESEELLKGIDLTQPVNKILPEAFKKLKR